jgi:hypothetical protein
MKTLAEMVPLLQLAFQGEKPNRRQRSRLLRWIAELILNESETPLTEYGIWVACREEARQPDVCRDLDLYLTHWP